MASTNITDELIEQIAKELAGKYHLEEDGLREVAKRLQEGRAARGAANDAFAKRFMGDHAETFKRLGA